MANLYTDFNSYVNELLTMAADEDQGRTEDDISEFFVREFHSPSLAEELSVMRDLLIINDDLAREDEAEVVHIEALRGFVRGVLQALTFGLVQ